jgi:hypothetical protein
MMIDFGTAKILSHRRNIQRCVTLLATELTELERQYLTSGLQKNGLSWSDYRGLNEI